MSRWKIVERINNENERERKANWREKRRLWNSNADFKVTRTRAWKRMTTSTTALIKWLTAVQGRCTWPYSNGLHLPSAITICLTSNERHWLQYKRMYKWKRDAISCKRSPFAVALTRRFGESARSALAHSCRYKCTVLYCYFLQCFSCDCTSATFL